VGLPKRSQWEPVDLRGPSRKAGTFEIEVGALWSGKIEDRGLVEVKVGLGRAPRRGFPARSMRWSRWSRMRRTVEAG